MVVLIISCSKVDIKIDPQFPILNAGSQSFEYYYDFSETLNIPMDTLQLKTIQNVAIGDAFYTAFYYLNDSSELYIHNNETKRIIYNFLPLRYEKGNYYETIESYYIYDVNEVCILKDNMAIGDSWFTTRIGKSDMDTLNYKIEITDIIPEFSTREYNYKNVFKIKQTISAISSKGVLVNTDVSYHFYNKDYGIIRKEIPPIQSGTYSRVIFDRIINY
jgi:hypothetical protein